LDGYGARIRMFRLGIGDCFLLTFAEAGQERHVLIDCGILQGSPNAKARLKAVAESIRDATSNHLDLLVATHEHWDHVAGFLEAADIFDAMTIDQIWVAWTEDPSDSAASRLKQDRRLRLEAIHLAVAALARSDDDDAREYGRAIAGVMGFYGGPSETATILAFSERTEEAMRKVTERRDGATPVYCRPGDVRAPWKESALKVYVLGPPRDERYLNNLRSQAKTDLYRLSVADGLYAAALIQFVAAGGDRDNIHMDDRSFPFHPSLRWTKEEIGAGSEVKPLDKVYSDEANAWRRIDTDWLLSSARLALQLNDATNNTSLVLAFELADGRVLLFPADAQIGSWKSWLSVAFKPAGEAQAPVTPRDLLQRTVFYKVGHHGSENATRKEEGLEAMTDRRLVAAIPVDQEFASTRRWRMPAAPLLKRLTERARGRVLRADAAWQPPDAAPSEGVPSIEWERFRAAVRADPGGMFVDYLL
jgi:hypothetical protein